MFSQIDDDKDLFNDLDPIDSLKKYIQSKDAKVTVLIRVAHNPKSDESIQFVLESMW